MDAVMEPHRWRRIEELYQSALQRPPELRAGFLAAECNSDAELRREVEELLGYREEAGGTVERPVRDGATEAVNAVQFQPGAMLGPYRILGAIGTGGMG